MPLEWPCEKLLSKTSKWIRLGAGIKKIENFLQLIAFSSV